MKKRVLVGFAMALALGACDAAEWPQYNEELGAPVLDPIRLSGVEEPLPRLEEPTVFAIPAGHSSEKFGAPVLDPVPLSGVEEPLPRLEEPTVFVIPAGQSSEKFGPEIAKALQLSSDISDDTMVYQLLQIGRVHGGQWVGCGTSQCTDPPPIPNWPSFTEVLISVRLVDQLKQ